MLRGLVVTSVLMLAATEASATLVKAFPLTAMVHEAHAIVRGEVVDEEAVYDPAWGQVYTHTLVRVDEVLAGSQVTGSLVVVRQLGGVLDGLCSQVVGTVRFAIGDEIVVFTRTDGAFHYLVGMAQGAFAVERPAGGPATLVRTLEGLVLTELAAPAAAPPPDRWTLPALRSVVATVRGGR